MTELKTLDHLIATQRSPRDIAIAMCLSYLAEQDRLSEKASFLGQQSNYFAHRKEIWTCHDKSRKIGEEIAALQAKFDIGDEELA